MPQAGGGAADELPRPALRRRRVPAALQLDGAVHASSPSALCWCASSSSRSSRATTTAPRRATTSSARSASRPRAASIRDGAGQGARGEPAVVQRLRRARAARHEARRGRRSSTTCGSRRRRAGRASRPSSRTFSDDPGPRRASADPGARGHLARRRGDARDARRRAARRRGRAGPGALLPAGRARRARARLHGADRRRDARAAAGRSGYVEGDRIGATGVERAWESYLRGTRGWEKVVVDARGVRHSGAATKDLIDEPRRLEPVPGRDLRLTLDSISSRRSRRRCAASSPARSRRRRAHRAHPRALLEAGLRPQRSSPAARAWTSFASRSAGSTSIRSSPCSTRRCPARTRRARRSSRSPRSRRSKTRSSTRAPRSSATGYYAFGRRIFHCTHVHGQVDLHEAHRRSRATSTSTTSPKRSAWTASPRSAIDFGLGAEDRARREPRGRRPHADARLDDAAPQGAVPRRLHAERGDRAGRDHGDRAPARARVRRARQRRHALPAAARARGRDERRLDRAGFSAARAAHRHRAAREPRARRRRAPRRGERRGRHRVQGAPQRRRHGRQDRHRADVARRRAKDVEPAKAWYFNRDHAWFAGFAPAKSPEIAIVVLIEHGGAGGAHAAPVAMQVVRDYQRLQSSAARRARQRRSRTGHDGPGGERSAMIGVGGSDDLPHSRALRLAALHRRRAGRGHRRRQPLQRDQRLQRRARRAVRQPGVLAGRGRHPRGLRRVDRLPALRAPRLRALHRSASSASSWSSSWAATSAARRAGSCSAASSFSRASS